MKENIIYGLYHPVTKVPVYVGKTSNGLERPWKHILEKSHSKKVNKWVSDLKEFDLNPVIVVLDTAEDKTLLDKKEVFWINCLISEGHPLLNQRLISPAYFLLRSGENLEEDYLGEIRLFVRLKRKQNKLTQEQLAEKAGVGLRFVRELEQAGTNTNFQTDSIQKILNLFGVRLSIS